MTTKRQKAAVYFCEKWLHVSFEEDINNFEEVSNFLSQHLDDAKNTAKEIACEYQAYIANLD